MDRTLLGATGLSLLETRAAGQAGQRTQAEPWVLSSPLYSLLLLLAGRHQHQEVLTAEGRGQVSGPGTAVPRLKPHCQQLERPSLPCRSPRLPKGPECQSHLGDLTSSVFSALLQPWHSRYWRSCSERLSCSRRRQNLN